MYRRFFAFSLPFLLALSACAQLAPSSPPLKVAIYNAYTDQPVVQTRFKVGTEQSIETDQSGTLTLTRWQPSMALPVAADDYETIALSTPVSVTAATAPLKLTLRPNTLRGTVTDAYGMKPLSQVSVTLQGSVTPTQTVVLSSLTDADGHYLLRGVPVSFTLQFSGAGYVTQTADLARQTNYDVALAPGTLSGVITRKDNGSPVAGAHVSVGQQSSTSDETGHYHLDSLTIAAEQAHISSSGFRSVTQPVTHTTQLDVQLETLRTAALVVDLTSGKPISYATVIATEEVTGTAMAFTRIITSDAGHFNLETLPEKGYVQVLAPGYRKATIPVSYDKPLPEKIELEPFQARALYVKTSVAAYTPERLEEFFDVIDRTNANALVIDLKSDNLVDLGLIYYKSNVPIIQELGTSKDLMDIHAILAEAKKRNIYTIARVHIFAHDNELAKKRPDWAAQDTRTGKEFYADFGIAWMDPWNRNVWNYNIQLGVEAAHMGFDEVQFDYIRFPNDASDREFMRLSKPVDTENPKEMYENIAEFMRQAHLALNSAGAFFSVDVFGYAAWGPQPVIGQNLKYMAQHADYVCPMVYPSHFGLHEMGFDNAAAHPYEIIQSSMKHGAVLTANTPARVRPWLQDFTLIWVPDNQIVRYGEAEVRAQIRAVEESPGNAGWSLWSSDNEYTYSALDPQ